MSDPQIPSDPPWHERLIELLSTLEWERVSGEIQLKTEHGRGVIWIEDGQIVDAELGSLNGQAAMFRLLNSSEVSYEIAFKPVLRERVIHESLQELLEARTQRALEWRRLLEIVPSLDTIPALNRELLDAHRAQLSESEFQLLSYVDGRRTLLEIIDDSGLDALGVLERIGSYFQSGLLGVSTQRPSAFPRDVGD